MYPSITRHKNKIDNLFKKYDDPIIKNDIELSAHWSRYLCILVYGYLEQSIKTIFLEYSSNKSHKRVARYVDSKLSYFQSADMDNIFQLVDSFDHDWFEELNISLDESIKSSVDSVVYIRHVLAHGGDHGISGYRLFEYYNKINDLINILYKKCC